MAREIKTIFEDGVLKPETPLSLDEHQRVTVVVHDESGVARKSPGLLGWVRREKKIAALAGLLFIALVIGVAVSSHFANTASQHLTESESNRRIANRNLSLLYLTQGTSDLTQ